MERESLCDHEWVETAEITPLTCRVAASYESGNEYGPYTEVEYGSEERRVINCLKCGCKRSW